MCQISMLYLIHFSRNTVLKLGMLKKLGLLNTATAIHQRDLFQTGNDSGIDNCCIIRRRSIVPLVRRGFSRPSLMHYLLDVQSADANGREISSA